MQADNRIKHASKWTSLHVKSDDINNGNIYEVYEETKLLSITNQNVLCSFKGLSFLTLIFSFISDSWTIFALKRLFTSPCPQDVAFEAH